MINVTKYWNIWEYYFRVESKAVEESWAPISQNSHCSYNYYKRNVQPFNRRLRVVWVRLITYVYFSQSSYPDSRVNNICVRSAILGWKSSMFRGFQSVQILCLHPKTLVTPRFSKPKERFRPSWMVQSNKKTYIVSGKLGLDNKVLSFFVQESSFTLTSSNVTPLRMVNFD